MIKMKNAKKREEEGNTENAQRKREREARRKDTERPVAGEDVACI